MKVKIGYILGDKSSPQLQERTNKVRQWCTDNLGPSFERWMIVYELSEDSLYFENEEDAILFKLSFKL